MRKMFFVAIAVATLASTGGAFAQSQQGGYLGLNPGASIAALPSAPLPPTSHEGGYLGINPGAHLVPAKPASPTLSEELSNAIAWCVKSTDPDHCRAYAELNQSICVKNPEHYDACRYAMSEMWHP